MTITCAGVSSPIEMGQDKDNNKAPVEIERRLSWPNRSIDFVYCCGPGETKLPARKRIKSEGDHLWWRISTKEEVVVGQQLRYINMMMNENCDSPEELVNHSLLCSGKWPCNDHIEKTY